MKKFIVILAITGAIISWPARILAAPANHIVISEIQTSSVTDSSQEFVELYNPTNAEVSLKDWTLEYASSAGTSWTKKSTLFGNIPRFGFFLISTASYAAVDNPMSSGLASAGGHVRIKNASGTIIDLVGYGTAAHPEDTIVDAPVAGGSIERIPGRLNPLAGNGEDSDDNGNDFVLREVAEPQASISDKEIPGSVPVQVSEPEPEPDPVIPTVYLPIYITELLPDPTSPLSDAQDEFIELYNPNDVTVNLKGYTLRAGSGFKSYYTIGEASIGPGAYLSFYSADTKLGLTNSGGTVQVLDPLGTILDVSDSYGTAKAGQAWADINGIWAWTLESTPNAANILTEPAPKAAAATKAKATTKKAAAKKTTTKKAAAKKTSKATTKKLKLKLPKLLLQLLHRQSLIQVRWRVGCSLEPGALPLCMHFMDLGMTYTTTTSKPNETSQLGYKIGQLCRGGETIELVSDLGGGKTVFVQGLAKGLGYTGEVNSPTFVISRDYQLPRGLSLHHFDLYRIHNGDVAAMELAEFIADPKAITAVEWGSNVSGVLPEERITVTLIPKSEEDREVAVATTPNYNYIIEGLQA